MGRSPHPQPRLDPHRTRRQKQGRFLSSSQPHTPCRVPRKGRRLLLAPGFSGVTAGHQESKQTLLPTSPKTWALVVQCPHSVPLPHAPVFRVPEPHWQQGVNGDEQVIKEVPLPPPSSLTPQPHPHPRSGDRKGQRQLMFPVTPGPLTGHYPALLPCLSSMALPKVVPREPERAALGGGRFGGGRDLYTEQGGWADGSLEPSPPSVFRQAVEHHCRRGWLGHSPTLVTSPHSGTSCGG